MNDNPIQPPTAPDVETLMEQLRDPAVLLANALGRIHEADAAQAEIDGMGGGAAMRRDHFAETAAALTTIARVAAELADRERAAHHGGIVDARDEEYQAMLARVRGAEMVPRAVNGVKFAADLTGHHVGVVAGREWLHVPGRGFIDVTHAQADGGTVDGARFQLTGRVVSATPDHILGITDGGTSVTLPWTLVVESPDE